MITNAVVITSYDHLVNSRPHLNAVVTEILQCVRGFGSSSSKIRLVKSSATQIILETLFLS